jgi:RimJ/RimL family protein N-acetyltransferase
MTSPTHACEPLATERLQIRALQAADLDDLMEVNTDPLVTQHVSYATWMSERDAQAWLQKTLTRQASGEVLTYVIVLKATGKVIGTILLFRMDAIHARAEIGYVLGRRHWGQGLMRESLNAFITDAFVRWALHRLEAEVDPRNESSNALLRRLGFTHEGRLRERWRKHDAPYDTNIYGLLRNEWLDRPRQPAGAGPQSSN